MLEGGRIKADRERGKRDGRSLWLVTVPANGSASLLYRVRD